LPIGHHSRKGKTTYRDIDNGNDERGAKWIDRRNGTFSRGESNLRAVRKNHVFPDFITVGERERIGEKEGEILFLNNFYETGSPLDESTRKCFLDRLTSRKNKKEYDEEL